MRRIYLYLFLFAATMTALSGVVYCVFKVLSWALGSPPPALADLGLAVAYSLIAVGVWLYHGYVLRMDHRLSRQEEARQHAGLRVVVLDTGAGTTGNAVSSALTRQMPGLAPQTILVDAAAEKEDVAAQLAEADLIVSPWTLLSSLGAAHGAPAELVQAVLRSPARKVLIPVRAEGWQWAGVDRWDDSALVEQVAHAARQSLEGDEVKPVRPLSASTVILIVIGVLIGLPALVGFVAAILDL